MKIKILVITLIIGLPALALAQATASQKTTASPSVPATSSPGNNGQSNSMPSSQTMPGAFNGTNVFTNQMNTNWPGNSGGLNSNGMNPMTNGNPYNRYANYTNPYYNYTNPYYNYSNPYVADSDATNPAATNQSVNPSVLSNAPLYAKNWDSNNAGNWPTNSNGVTNGMNNVSAGTNSMNMNTNQIHHWWQFWRKQ